MFQGCAYRRRTGACNCDNPPIGCVRDVPAPGLSFPAAATSYSQLRQMQNAGVQARPAAASPAQPDPAPRLPALLPLELKGGRSEARLVLPSLGWVCAEAVAPPAVRLLFCGGNAAVEAAVASSAPGCVLATSVPAAAADLPAAVAAAVSRLGSLHLLLVTAEALEGVEAAFASAHAAAAQHSPGTHVGLQCLDARLGHEALTRLLRAGTPPAVLALPLSPSTGAFQRALLGLCRRQSILVIALAPCGGAAGINAAAPAAARQAACAGRDCAASPATAEAEALLAWCVGREVVALVSGEELPSERASALAAGGLLDLSQQQRAALDAVV